MKQLIVLVAVVALVGAAAIARSPGHPVRAAPPEPDTQAPRPASVIAHWIGRSEDELVAAWGEPSRIKRMKGGDRLLVFKVGLYEGTVVVPGVMIPLPASPAVPGSSEPRIDHHPYSTPYADAGSVHTPGSARSRTTGKLKVRFRLDSAGRIIDVEIRGPGKKKRKNAEPPAPS